MQLNEIHESIKEAISDDQALPHLSREIGRKLALNRLEVLDRLETLDELRTALEKASHHAKDYTRGFLEALAEVVRAYQAELMPSKDDESIIALASRQARWPPALEAMKGGPVRPTELRTLLRKRRDDTELELSTVSRLLKDMRDAGLVELFSGPGADGRMRPHHLTSLGRRVLADLSSKTQFAMDSAAMVTTVNEETIVRPVAAKRDSAEPIFPRMVKSIPQVAQRASTGV